MGSSRTKKKAASPVEAPEDLEEIVKEAVRSTPGVTPAGGRGIKKVLPPSYRAFEKQAKELLQGLASRGEIHSAQKGKATHYFDRAPLEALDERLFTRLGEKVASKEELKALAQGLAPGFDVVLEDWIKRRVAEKRLFEHAGVRPRQKLYGTRPDLRKALAKVLAELKKALKVTDAQGISRETLASVLLEELGVRSGAPVEGSETSDAATGLAPSSSREQFLAALSALLAENPRQALLSVRDLRARLSFSKPEFDAVALALSREGSVSLHYHDHPHALSESERDLLVEDARGNYYIGIAPGRGN